MQAYKRTIFSAIFALLALLCPLRPALADGITGAMPGEGLLLAQAGAAGVSLRQGAARSGGPQVVYGFDREFPPFSFEDARGRPTGFEVDLVRAIASEAGLNIAYRPLEWSKIQPELSTGAINMTTGMIRTERRSVVFLFSKEPYYAAQLRIFTRTVDYVRDLAKLRGRIIGVEENSFAGEVLARYPGLGMHPFSDKTSGLRAVHDAQVTGYLGIGPNVDWLLNKLRYIDIVPAGEPLERLEMWFAVDKQNRALLDKLEQGYEAVVRSGAYDLLYRQWFVEELAPEERDGLIAAAYEAIGTSHVTYSKSPKGAAVLCRGGNYYAAGPVEHANEHLSISAVQAAVVQALAAGELEIRAVAQVDARGTVEVPMAADLEFLAEFNRGILVALPPVNNETAESTLAEMISISPVRPAPK